MKNYQNTLIGYVLGMLSGITYAIQLLFSETAMSSQDFSNVSGSIANVISLIMNIIYLIIVSAIILKNKEAVKFKAFITKKNMWMFVAANFVISPLAAITLLLAVQNIGSGYASIVTSIYPALGAAMAFVFFKEKLSVKGIAGLIMCVGAIAYNAYSPNNNVPGSFIIGLTMGLVCALSWASMTMVSAGILKQAMPYYYPIFISAIASIPSLAFFVFTKISFAEFLVILTMPHTVHIVLSCLSGFISIAVFNMAIKRIGATRSMCLNISYSAWAVILSAFLGTAVTFTMVISSAVVLLGATLTILPKRGAIKQQ